MTAPRFTKGPWKFDQPGNWHGLSARVAPEEDMGKIIATVDTSGWGKRTGLANAALIASSPDLYAYAECEEALHSESMTPNEQLDVFIRHGFRDHEGTAKSFCATLRSRALSRARGSA